MHTNPESYSLGVIVGMNLRNQVLLEDLDIADLLQGVEDVLKGSRLEIPEVIANQKAQDYLQKVSSRKAINALTEEEQYFKENALREGVIKHPSGIQYEVLVAGEHGTGHPSITDRITAHYEGRLVNGKVFDSSIERGQPFTFRLNQVIRGWQEALKMMTKGAKWRVYIPSVLGYGARGAGNDIPPNATLIFDVEMISFAR